MAIAVPPRAPCRTPCTAISNTATWARITPWWRFWNGRWKWCAPVSPPPPDATPEEIAITRNASESLENAQYGVDLKPGDEVLTTNQDYPRMLTTFQQRERREGIVLKTISFPVPTIGMDDLYQRFERAVTPKTKLILVCHITNRTGQIFPIRRICDMAHARNIPVICDGAHAFSQFPFKISDLDCDYYGTSLHKWTYAPIGTGFLFVKKSRIASTWSLMASGEKQAGDIRKFEEIGTHPAANHNAITEALVFNENLGIDRKAARLRYLRDRWAHRLAENPKCQHPPQPRPRAELRYRLPGLPRHRSRQDSIGVVEQVRHPHLPDGAPGVHRLAHHAQRLHFAARDRHLLRQGGAGTARVAGNTRPLTRKGPRHPRQESRG